MFLLESVCPVSPALETPSNGGRVFSRVEPDGVVAAVVVAKALEEEFDSGSETGRCHLPRSLCAVSAQKISNCVVDVGHTGEEVRRKGAFLEVSGFSPASMLAVMAVAAREGVATAVRSCCWTHSESQLQSRIDSLDANEVHTWAMMRRHVMDILQWRT